MPTCSDLLVGRNRPPAIAHTLRALVLAAAISGAVLCAQTVPAPPPPPAPPAAGPATEEETIVLNPFRVDASSDVGYVATSTLGGTRLKSELRDVASQIDVMTSEFLDDIGALTFDEALRYSLNIETNEENFTPGTDPNTNSIFGAGYGSRTRGLTRSNNTHDFFETNVPLDTYNTGKRFTLVSGSNAILFGAGFAGGTNDVSFDRPELRRFSGNTTVRVDSNGSLRTSLNLNQPLKRNVLGVRLAALRANEKDYRELVGAKTERLYASLLLQPSKRFTVRGWFESYDQRQRNAANTLVSDRVTPWLATATRPPFNNAGLTATNTAAQFNTAFNAQGADLAASAERFSNALAVVVFNPNLSQTQPVQVWTNTVTSRRPLDGTQDPSITDPAVYPRDAHVIGNALQRRWTAHTRGAVFEFNPLRDLFVEGGYNHEVFNTRNLSFIGAAEADLRIDLNRFLPDGVTPNPNLGRTYVEDEMAGSQWRNEREEKRLQAAYAFDFERSPGWRRWLGRHQVAVMYTDTSNMRVQHNNNNPRLVSDNTFAGITYPAGTSSANDTARNTRRLRARFYLDTPVSSSGTGVSHVRAPFDPWAGDTVVIGRDANGRDVVVNTGLDHPYGAQVRTSNGLKADEAWQYALQSRFWQDRLNLTFGVRSSRASFAPWVGQGGSTGRDARRFNAVTGRYEEPVQVGTTLVFASTGQAVGNAGFEPYSVMLARGGEHDSLDAPVSYRVSSRLKSVVLHPLGKNRFASLHYTESGSAFVADFTRKTPYGSEAQLDDGTTKEYGFSLRFLEDRLVLRVNWYESLNLGVSGGTGLTVPAPAAVGGASGMERTDLRWTAIHLEKSVQNYYLLKSGGVYETATTGARVLGGANNGIRSDSPFAYLQNDVLGWPSETAASGTYSLKYNIGSDRSARGQEYRLVANPTPGWSLSLSLAKNRTRNERIGTAWFAFLNYRIKDWVAAASDTNAPQRGGGTGPTQLHITAGTNTNETMLAYLRSAALGWFFLRESEGQSISQEVEWRSNVTTSYRFRSGWLKGFRVGGSVRYRGERTLGYRDRTLNASDFTDPLLSTPGLFPAGSSVTVADLAHPIKGGSVWNTDAVLGYSTSLFSRRVRWNINLNVRNVLDDDRLIPQNGLSAAGRPVVFQYPEPRVFLLTNSFDF
jgi:hypothetical protein